MDYKPNKATQRLKQDLRSQVLQAAKNNDLESLKKAKSQIGKNRWLERWAANGSKMEYWLLDDDENQSE